MKLWRRRRLIDEIEALEREIDRMFDEILYGKPMWDPAVGCFEPLTHMDELEDKIIVTVDLPYVRKEDIILDVTPDSLRIEAKMARPIKYERWGTIQRSCIFKGFKKELRLPGEVVPGASKARFKDGYLIVELPKKAVRHKIEVE
ncbi:MAG: Hsp20/alpha crystallin family protein [Candidatus Bathyarchaeia archaeon]